MFLFDRVNHHVNEIMPYIIHFILIQHMTYWKCDKKDLLCIKKYIHMLFDESHKMLIKSGH